VTGPPIRDGVVRLTLNEAHGIKAIKPIPFNRLMELPQAIEEALIRGGITLHPSKRTQKYLRPRPQ
jgi:hypothetical protein